MKVVVLSYCNALATQAIGLLHERHPIDALLRVEWQPRPSQGSRVVRFCKSPVAQLQRAINRRVENWQHHRHIERVAELFSGCAKPLPDVPTYTVGSRQLNSPAAQELIASLAPDILLVSHAPLLKPALFQLPTLATVNIHWGIAPEYCGEHTIFWPLYFRDYAKIGVTLHRIDEGIDTGPILAQGFPRLAPHDDEPALLARCATVASELACEMLDAAEAGDPLTGMRRNVRSRLFLHRDRHALHSLDYWARRHLCGEKLPTIAARRQLYFNSPAAHESVCA